MGFKKDFKILTDAKNCSFLSKFRTTIIISTCTCSTWLIFQVLQVKIISRQVPLLRLQTVANYPVDLMIQC